MSSTPALIVLDLNLPDIDGIEVCRRIRKTGDVPILMLTARDEDVDKIIGLEVGADDYLTKPFNPRELVARVKSVLRRSTTDRKELETAVIQHGDLVVDAGRREVRVDDEEVQLAPKEFDLLWELLDHRGLVLTRDQLLERVWGYTFAATRARSTCTCASCAASSATRRRSSPSGASATRSRPRASRRRAAGKPRSAGMFRSLRFQLPALFLAGVIIFGARRGGDRVPAALSRTRSAARGPTCGARRRD